MMKYKGYTGRITAIDEEQGLLHGEVADIIDVITFAGKSVEELIQAFQESVDDYLEFCQERNEIPDRPYSGKFVIRIEPELHKKSALAAKQAGQSLNEYVTSALQHYLEHPSCRQPRRKQHRATKKAPASKP